MTSTFDFATPANAAEPKLAATHELDTTHTLLECKVGLDGLSGTFAGKYNPESYTPLTNTVPKQASTPKRRAPSGPVGPCGPTAKPTTSAHSTPIAVVKAGRQGRTRIGAAGDSLQQDSIADTGPQTGKTVLAGAALLAAGAVTVAAAAQVARTVTPATGPAADAKSDDGELDDVGL